MPLFHPRLLGLTGEPAAIQNAARRLPGLLQARRFADKGDDYTVDHSAFIYLMDRDGKYLGFFPPGTPAEKMVEMIRPHLAGSPSR